MSHSEAHATVAVNADTPGVAASRHSRTNAEMEDCITGCLACHAICLQTVYHCLDVGGARAGANHIRTLLECAELCASSVHLMVAESPFQGRVCALCAEACRTCEAACRRMGDTTDLRCADSCRRCAEMLPHAA